MARLLVISPERWSAHPVSKHHYAAALADAGHDVVFLEPPVSTGVRKLQLASVAGHPRLRVLRATRVAPGLRFMPSPVRTTLERRWLRRVEKAAGLSFDVVWSYDNSRFFDLTFAANRLKVYHQVDLDQDFNARDAAESADICFCTTDFIAETLRPFSDRVFKIHHATAHPSCDETPLGDAPGHPGTACRAGIQAALIGNFDRQYLDVGGIAGAVRKHPEVTFHFVGDAPAHVPTRRACESAENVVWWGKVPPSHLPGILEKVDINLVAYKTPEHEAQMASPHKFMEYLLSGKVIVASYTDEYKDKRHLVEMAESGQPLHEVFSRVVANLDHYNSAEKQAARRAFALDHTYERQIERIDALIQQHTGRSLAAPWPKRRVGRYNRARAALRRLKRRTAR